VTGTFLGDYCGILLDAKITGFPFNVLDNPMYVGSSMSFLGTSLWYDPAGQSIDHLCCASCWWLFVHG